MYSRCDRYIRKRNSKSVNIFNLFSCFRYQRYSKVLRLILPSTSLSSHVFFSCGFYNFADFVSVLSCVTSTSCFQSNRHFFVSSLFPVRSRSVSSDVSFAVLQLRLQSIVHAFYVPSVHLSHYTVINLSTQRGPNY